MAVLPLIPSFNSGELSPLLRLRSDLEKYRSGCRTLENFHITPYGGVKRRAGFAYYGTAHGRCRLFRFQESTELGYIMEFSDKAIHWYLNGVVRDAAGDPYTLTTPYSADDLADLQMVQINSVAYFTHPAFPPYKLRRIHNAEWEFAPVDFTYPAMLEENLDKASTLTTSVPSGTEPGNVMVTASQPIFQSGHEGAYFQISHERQLGQFETVVGAVDHDVPPNFFVIVQGAWNLTASGTWTGTFTLQRSADEGATWTSIRQFTSSEDRNFSAGGVEESRVRMRLGWHYGGKVGNTYPKCVLEAVGPYLRGLVRITDYISPTQVKAQVLQTVEMGTTSYWREGAWSAVCGYPRTVTAHEQRIVYGGNEARPSTVWASRVDDYENFTPGGTKDDDSWTHAMASDQQNTIQWMVSQKSLLIGTSGDEWVLSSSKQEGIITPTNVQVLRNSGHGSEFLKARVVNDSILFVQRGGRKVRDLSYDFQADGYVSSDLMLLAEHIAEDGIVDTAYQTHPLPALWCVTKGGNLISLTYDKAQNITGWTRHTTGKNTDGFESVAVRATEGEEDQVWVVARRRINGTDERYIERLCSGGFFLEEPWSELYGPTDGVLEWQEASTHFPVGAIVQHHSQTRAWQDGDAAEYCAVEHDATAANTLAAMTGDGNYPPASGMKWCTVASWESFYDYNIGDPTAHVSENSLFYYNFKIYRTKAGAYPLGQYTRSLTKMADGYTWDDYWAALTPGAMPAGPPPVWSAGASYTSGEYVTKAGVKYRATSTHPAIAANAPGLTSAPWAAQVQGTYAIGDLVSADGKNYVCTYAHTPSPSNRPGTGAYWKEHPSDNLLFYVDSGVSKFGDTITTTGLTGFGHLIGETVQILADGEVLAPRVVTAAGKIMLDQPGDPALPVKFSSISVGLPYDSILEPMALEIGLQNGTSVSRERRIYDLVIYFHKTSCGKVSDSTAGPYDTLFFRTGDMAGKDPVPLFTGAYYHKLESRHGRDASFVIKQDQPLPMTVLAVVPKWNVYGD